MPRAVHRARGGDEVAREPLEACVASALAHDARAMRRAVGRAAGEGAHEVAGGASESWLAEAGAVAKALAVASAVAQAAARHERAVRAAKAHVALAPVADANAVPGAVAWEG